jgi:BirA family transcriptional regulator, biotin operon repressor / biotin---[acetyl-CoA-carboxylase] ligase
LGYLSPGQWISGEDIAFQLGISRSAVWKQIQSLRAKGYEIDSATNRGYRLVGRIDLLFPENILSGLNGKIVGRDLRYFIEAESTNNLAKSIAQSCRDGTVVLAETQTNGRGRLSRTWASPPGGIWMSIVLKPKIPLAKAYRINMAVSIAISRVLFALYGLHVGIKWPNDLLVNERKICGILTEISAEMDKLDFAVVGIGINANMDVSEFPDQWMATSLSCELGHEVSRDKLIRKLIEEIDIVYGELDAKEIHAEWCQRSATLGKQVRISTFHDDIEGEAIALSEDGALRLRTQNKEICVLAGDCVHLRAAREAEKEEDGI